MAQSKKFNFSLPDDQKEVIQMAAKTLGVDMAEVVRIGAYRFATLVLDGSLDALMLREEEK